MKVWHTMWDSYAGAVLLGVVGGSVLLLFLINLGCTVEGHRKFTVVALGQTFVVEDKVSPNDQGKQEYTVSFDEAGLNVIGWVIDLFKPEPADEPADAPVGAGTVGDGT